MTFAGEVLKTSHYSMAEKVYIPTSEKIYWETSALPFGQEEAKIDFE